MRLLLLFLFFTLAAEAQPIRFFKHFTEKDGLSDNHVQCVLRDRQGWLWVGTTRGLNRFDGQKFKQFLPDAAHPERTVSNECINSIAEDSEGFVWIATRNGLNRFDPRTERFSVWRNTGLDDGSLPNSLVYWVQAEKNGGLWVCCDNRDLCFLDTRTGRFQTFEWKKMAGEALPEAAAKDYKTIYGLSEKSADDIWLHTNLGLFSFDKRTSHFQFHLKFQPGRLPAAAPTDCPDRQYLGSWANGVLRRDACTGRFSQLDLPISEKEKVGLQNVGLVFPMGENYWVISAKGLFLLDPRRDVLHAVKPARDNCFSAPTGSISAFFKEEDGTVWLAGEAGLWQFDPRLQGFQYHALDPELEGSFYNTYCRIFDSATDGRRYVLNYFGNELSVFEHEKRLRKWSLPGRAALLFETRDGRLWVGGGGRIFHLDRKNGELVELPLPQKRFVGEPSHIFQDMAEDAAGNLWFASNNVGVLIFSPHTNEWRKPSAADGFIGKGISSLQADTARQVVWVGSDEYGLFRFEEKTGAWQLFRHDERQPKNSLSAYMVRGLCLDGAGNLWAATDPGGLCRFDGKRFLTLGTEAGLPSNQVCSVVRDRAGNIWAGTTRGLAWVDFRTLRVRSFDRHSGMENDYLDLPLSISPTTGEGFAGSKFGYMSFQPDRLLHEKPAEKILITAFRIFDKNVADSLGIKQLQNMQLSWRENFFSVDFASTDFSRPEKNEFSHRLLGFDADWNFTGRQSSAAWTNVPPGDYVLEIRSGREGRWNEPGIRLNIHISPPFWATLGFRLLAAAALVGAIWGLYRWRIGQIRKEEALKTTFNQRLARTEMAALRAQMNPHFVFNCLSSINRFILVNQPDEASVYLTKFSRLIRLILDNSRSETVPLDKELEALQLYVEMEQMRFSNRFEYRLTVARDVRTDHLEVPPLLIQPFVENAIWHGLMHKKTPGMLQVRVFYEGKKCCIEVEDDGIGRRRAIELKSRSATVNKSLGMKMTAERLEVINQLYGTNAVVTTEDLQDAQGEAAGTRVLVCL